MLTYNVVGAEVTAEGHRQQAAVAAATGLADAYGAAVKGGLLPLLKGSRGGREVYAMRGLRSHEGRQGELARKHAKYQEKWDSREDFRLENARKGRTRDNSAVNTVAPWQPRHAHDAFPGAGVLAGVPAYVIPGPLPPPARERTVAAARAKAQDMLAARTAWPKDSRGRFTMGAGD
ncbi:MAG: hypothetical protein GY772_26960 [bacterium]|nr:hypothetical protein [bacterium]